MSYDIYVCEIIAIVHRKRIWKRADRSFKKNENEKYGRVSAVLSPSY